MALETPEGPSALNESPSAACSDFNNARVDAAKDVNKPSENGSLAGEAARGPAPSGAHSPPGDQEAPRATRAQDAASSWAEGEITASLIRPPPPVYMPRCRSPSFRVQKPRRREGSR